MTLIIFDNNKKSYTLLNKNIEKIELLNTSDYNITEDNINDTKTNKINENNIIEEIKNNSEKNNIKDNKNKKRKYKKKIKISKENQEYLNSLKTKN